jgi:addiction module RelE/StbE family toxin
MRAIERTSRFKRDYRREKSGVLGKKLDQLLIEAIELLAADRPLPQRYVDHPLSGEWSGFRDCHVTGSFGSPPPNRLDRREPMFGEVFEAFDHFVSEAPDHG